MGAPVLLLAGNPGPLTGPGTNTWLLDGGEPTLVDAGVGDPCHLESLARHLAGRPLARVLVTHGHPDHVSGVPALRRQWPGIEVCRWIRPGEPGITSLHAGARVRAGDRALQVIHTPGHAPDHVCFWDEASGGLFAGDMVIEGSSVMIPAGRGGDLRAYLASLERMAALRPARIWPGHGAVIERPLDVIAEYLEHRRRRDAQVRECLASGVSDVDAIVARIYPGVADNMRAAARLTVEAHLETIKQDPP